jgi:uncharacterized protein
MGITFQFGDLEVPATLNDSSTAELIRASLPMRSKVNLWGDEIYFEIPIKVGPDHGTTDLKVGDIAYWPQGSCLCLFFGKTPASTDEKPRPASEVNVIGTFATPAELLKQVPEGSQVRVSAR